MGLLAEFGLSQFQINMVNEKLSDLNKDQLHSSNRISMLSQAVDYNSKKIDKVLHYSRQAMHILKNLLKQINNNFAKINSQINTS